MRIKQILFLVFSMLLPLAGVAQTGAMTNSADATETSKETDEDGFHITQMYGEARFGFHTENDEWYTNNDNTNFRGDYLNFGVEAQITKGVNITYRQRFNKTTTTDFFESTDLLYFDWQATRHFSFSAGKQVMAVGGFEYERAPIDLYYNSEFWNNIACYQWGASIAYQLTRWDKILFQVCNSPFHTFSGNENTYAVNVMWCGNHGDWETRWSANLIKVNTILTKKMSYIAVGNRFYLPLRMRLDIDVMNRAASRSDFFFGDWSLMTELSCKPSDATRLFLKYTHDECKTDYNFDYSIRRGTDIDMYSAGFECSPVKNDREAMRIFVVGGYATGTNTYSKGVLLYDSERGKMAKNQLLVEVGAKIRVSKK